MSLNYRTLNLVGFVSCVLLLVSALIMQHVFELEPCPLCIFQRVAFMAAAAIFLVAAIHNPQSTGQKVYTFLNLAALISGVGLALRHIWLQNLPADKVPSCGPGLDYMLEVLPFTDVINTVLKGSGECAEVSWTFLGLSIPWWTLFAYIALCAWCIFSLKISKR
ncbi:disulfide bond formation protein DsbB [Oceanospirillum multiglobuliferum]|uniref:Disulfide bond formation protein B n=1 Tax=Oceanospirillum multiglobuliferum TaxID=64969 RepID=A0A1T4QCJ6_9GAMM|nr:disulfide bond formation protein B [Oceanospirillum multiglobuliferum]OPX56510.1 disulfide bond formation protein B [Oceanospirillum multiglobuliferum]SKA01513.1 disulfide bond formation protein DsbB [Oceanospirillum multiglobuliferum]